MTNSKPVTYLVIMSGKHRAAIGWMKGTWADRVAAAKRWGVLANSQKVFVHGIEKCCISVRFAHVREATALEIGLWEQERERKAKRRVVLSFPGDPDLELT